MGRYGLLVVIGLILSCAGDDETPAGRFSEQCMGGGCAEGLTCQQSICTAQCTNDAQCEAFGSGTACISQWCFRTCEDTFECRDLLCHQPNGVCLP